MSRADRIQSASVADRRSEALHRCAKRTRADADFSVAGAAEGQAAERADGREQCRDRADGPHARRRAAPPARSRRCRPARTRRSRRSTAWSSTRRLDRRTTSTTLRCAPPSTQRRPSASRSRPRRTGGRATAEGREAAQQPPQPTAPNVEEEAKVAATRLAGWVYEIPEYKYEAIFKPLDSLLKHVEQVGASARLLLRQHDHARAAPAVVPRQPVAVDPDPEVTEAERERATRTRRPVACSASRQRERRAIVALDLAVARPACRASGRAGSRTRTKNATMTQQQQRA